MRTYCTSGFEGSKGFEHAFVWVEDEIAGISSSEECNVDLPKDENEDDQGKKKYSAVSSTTATPKILNTFALGPPIPFREGVCRYPPFVYPRLPPFKDFSALSYESLCDGERDNRLKKFGNIELSVFR